MKENHKDSSDFDNNLPPMPNVTIILEVNIIQIWTF
jgi:hypothetical protein